MTDNVIPATGPTMGKSRAWSIQLTGKIRVHHRSCPHAPASLHGRVERITLGELLDRVKRKEVEAHQICGVCGQQPRHFITEETLVSPASTMAPDSAVTDSSRTAAPRRQQ